MSEARWEGRRLCPDGGCIGVLDERGRCPVCGRIDPAAATAGPAEADERDDRERPDGPDGSDGSDGSDRSDRSDRSDERAAEPSSAAAEPGSGDEWQTRQLCEDGSCIGVIERGRCNTCGKAPGT